MNIKTDRQKNNLLIKSYYDNDIDKFRELIKDGADINCLDNDGYSLIALVVSGQSRIENDEFFNILIENYVNIKPIKNAPLLLHLAILVKKRYYFDKLMELGINVNYINYSYDNNSNTHIIFDAITDGEYYHINTILNKGIDINIRSKIDEPILNHYIRHCEFKLTEKEQIDIFKKFIDLGADINDRGFKGMQAIHCATFYKKNKLLKILIKNKNIQLDSRDRYGNTSLYYAVKSNNIDNVKTLIKNGARTHLYNSQNDCALFYSMEHHYKEIFDILIDNNAAALSVDDRGCNILHEMIDYEWYGEMSFEKYYKKIIDKHPELLFQKNNDGKTPLDYLDKENKNHCRKNFLNKIANNIEDIEKKKKHEISL